ncbi:pilus assembly protein PilM [Eubacteriales bacterium OttesenSCG-928-N13]|nr:pilus assembly protein PilM [Eubacteriales bacterium OttesenSCG-928-N13]
MGRRNLQRIRQAIDISTQNTAAVIDFGTSKIVTIVAEDHGFEQCDIIGSGTVPYDGFSGGQWNAPDKVEAAIRDSINAAELESKTRIKEIYVGVPSEYIRVLATTTEVGVSSADRTVVEADRWALMDAAADKLDLPSHQGTVIHRSAAWFQLDNGKPTYNRIDGQRGEKLSGQIAFIIADPGFIEEASRLLNGLGISVLGFLSPTMGEAILLTSYKERDRALALIDVGYTSTEFSVVQGEAIVYHCILPLGGGHLTAALATELGIPMRAAEQIKRSYIFMPDEFDPVSDPEVIDESGRRLTFPTSLVKTIVEKEVDDLCEMLELTFKECSASLGNNSLVILTGGGLSMMRGGREYVAQKLGRPIKGALAKTAKLNSQKYASALGLVDLVLDSITQRTPQEESFPGRLAGGFRGLFKK